MLVDRDVVLVDGIPCTSVARTLLDLASVLDRRGVERAVDQAERLRLFDGAELEAVLARSGRRRGAALLRSVLAGYGGPTLTRSALEERFLTICRNARLPQPKVNHWIALGEGKGFEADFAWPERRLIVETDGWAGHGTARAFEHDRTRDRLLLVAGWHVARYTWRQVIERPVAVAEEVGRLLGGELAHDLAHAGDVPAVA